MPAAPQPALGGIPFGKYRLYERIAAGGMAEIYRAKYLAAAGVTKNVVIKKILPHYAGNKNFISMFVNEAKIAVGLSHGNVAQVFDFGEIDGEYFLAMEFVNGQTVSKVMRRARDKKIRVPTPYAVFIAMEMCKGLHYAHTRTDDAGRPQNIVHRDVSPQNVLVSYEGQVKIVDFGIAKARSAGDTDKTQAGAIKGKYVYFSPEQARARDMDGRTDVYATAVVLYEMLCGRLPVEGKMIDVLNRIIRGDFLPPSQINKEITPALERIILKGMATHKEERYPTALAFQDALAGYLFANAPRFSHDSLAQLMSWLFDDELETESNRVAISATFLEQLPLWRIEPGTDTSEPHELYDKTSWARKRSRSGELSSDAESQGSGDRDTGVAFAQRQRTMRIWTAAAVFIGGAAVAATVVMAVGRFRGFSVRVESEPSDAQINLDGASTGLRTPATLSGLSADREHAIDVLANGMAPWHLDVAPSRGRTVEVLAHLEKESHQGAPIPQQNVPEPAPAPAPVAAPAPVESDEAAPNLPAPPLAVYPTDTLFVDATTSAVSLPGSHAARIRLDPKKVYRATVEGTASLGGLSDLYQTHSLFYATERDHTGSAPVQFGFLTPRETVRITGARALYAFIVDDAVGDNSGQLTVRLKEQGTGLQHTLFVDSQKNAVFPDAQHGARFTNLGQTHRLSLEVHGSADLGGKRGQTQSAIYWYDGSFNLTLQGKTIDESLGVVKVGTPVTLEGPGKLVLFYPDDDPTDNAGGLTATLRIAPPEKNGIQSALPSLLHALKHK